VLGAAKAGTSSLAEYLGQHPQIEMVYVLTQGSSVALPGSISPRRPSRPGRSV